MPMHDTTWVPGIVVPSFSKAPLADEGEATVGDDDLNPATDPDAREEVERIKEKQRMYREGQKFLDECGGCGPLSDPPGAWGTDATADLPGVDFEPTVDLSDAPFADTFRF